MPDAAPLGTQVATTQPMWLEAILSSADLDRLARELAPVTLTLGTHATVRLEVPTRVALIAGRGLRVECPAMVHGSVLGLDLPLTVDSASLLLAPALVTRGEREVLAFSVSVESLDFAAVPGLVANAIVDSLNAAMSRHATELTWDYRADLSHSFALPSGLSPLPSLDLAPAWGELRITPEALVFAVSMHAGDESAPRPPRPSVRRRSSRGLRTTWTPARRVALFGAIALSLGLAALAFWRTRPGLET